MINIFIHGGCVSRDTFNYPGADEFNIVSYHTRSHIQSSLCSTHINSNAYLNLTSPFQQKQIKADFEKSFIKDLKDSAFDIFLMDFMGERNPLYIFHDGSRCTVSKWLSDTGFVAERLNSESGTKISPFSNEMFSLWEEAWEHLILTLKAYHCVNKLIVIKNYWALKCDDELDFGGVFTSEYINKANNYYHKIYNRMASDLDGSQFISPPTELLLASAEHRWGKAPFHYVDQFYLFILSELKKLSPHNAF